MEFIRKKKDLSILDTKPVATKELEVILTQKCNMACTHCMRGCSSNKQIDEETLDAIFEKFYYIDNLSLGGGEPTLAPDVVRMLTKSLKKHNVIVPNVNFTSNGTVNPDEFIDALLELQDYVIESRKKEILFEPLDPNEKIEPIYACFSFDDYHLLEILNGPLGESGLDVLYQNIAKFQNALSPDAIVCRLACDVDVIDLGRAKQLNPSENVKVPMVLPETLVYPYVDEKKRVTLGGLITISCDGEVIPPNIPFDMEKTLSFGNIKNLSLSQIFARTKTKKVSNIMFDFEISKLLKNHSAPKKKWRNYLENYGNKKMDIFYAHVNHEAEKQR